MSTPYLNRGESIVMTTHRVETGSQTYDVMLTNERLILMDSHYTRFEPRVISFSTIVSVKSGKVPTGEPAIILTLEEASDLSGSITVSLIFSQQPGEQRKEEREIWVRKLIELVVATRERSAGPNPVASRTTRGLHPTIRRWIAPEPVLPRTSVAEPAAPSRDVIEVTEEPGSPRFVRGDTTEYPERKGGKITSDEITGNNEPPEPGETRVMEPDSSRLTEVEAKEYFESDGNDEKRNGNFPTTEPPVIPELLPEKSRGLSFPVLKRSAILHLSEEESTHSRETPLKESTEQQPVTLSVDTIRSALRAMQPPPEDRIPAVPEKTLSLQEGEPAEVPTNSTVETPPLVAEETKTLPETAVNGSMAGHPLPGNTDPSPANVYPGKDGRPEGAVVLGQEVLQPSPETIPPLKSREETRKSGQNPGLPVPPLCEPKITVPIIEPQLPGKGKTAPPEHGPASGETPGIKPVVTEEPIPPRQNPSRQITGDSQDRSRSLLPVFIGIIVLLAVVSAIIITWSWHGSGENTPPLVTTPAVPQDTPSAISTTPASGVWVTIAYSGTFSGTVGNPGFLRQVSGTGTMTYPVIMNSPIVQAEIQKHDYSIDPLTVGIYNNGTLIAEKRVTAPMGEVGLLIDIKTAMLPGLASGKETAENRTLLGNGSLIYY